MEVVLTSEAQYEAAVDANQMKVFPSSRPPHNTSDNHSWPDSTCVCVSGIPSGCTESEIAQFFGQYSVQDIIIEQDKGRCFVKLSTSEAAHHAVSTLNNSGDNGNLSVEMCPPDAMAAASKTKTHLRTTVRQKRTRRRPRRRSLRKL